MTKYNEILFIHSEIKNKYKYVNDFVWKTT